MTETTVTGKTKTPLTKVWFVYKRELTSYFLSPLAYVTLAMFLLISGYFFALILLATQFAEMRGALANMGMIFMFMAPVLTMRLLADERRMGTDELLLTAPLSVADIVVGKYLAVVSVFAVGLLLTGLYPWFLVQYGNPDLVQIASGYLGLLLVGCTFLAVGLFASSLSDNQMVAGLIAFGLLLLLWLCGWAGDTIGGTLGSIFTAVSVMDRFIDFRRGIIDTAHIIFYLSYIAVFIYLAVRAVERRRWS